MRIPQLKNYLYRVNANGNIKGKGKQTVLVLGAPGIGKSLSTEDTAKEIANAMKKEFIDYSDDKADMILAEPNKYYVYIDFRLTECEPSDLIGIPFRVNGATRYSPLMWAKVLSQCAGMLVLDERYSKYPSINQHSKDGHHNSSIQTDLRQERFSY